jgi:septal ring-binding cell division protein DamX
LTGDLPPRTVLTLPSALEHRAPMRDAHRMKEKLDLSLDNRQIVSLLVSGIVVLGAVFVLGVVVGKKLAAQPQQVEAQDLLTSIDQQAAALEQVANAPPPAPDASLTFPDALTRAEPAPPINLPPDAEEEEQEQVQVPAAPEPPPRAAPVPTRTVAKEKPLQEAISKAQRPAEAVANGEYTLQLSASQDRAEVDRFVAKLRDRGYAPYVVEAEVEGKGTWFRVRMGSFGTKEAASRYLQDFRRETRLDAFVAKNN